MLSRRATEGMAALYTLGILLVLGCEGTVRAGGPEPNTPPAREETNRTPRRAWPLLFERAPGPTPRFFTRPSGGWAAVTRTDIEVFSRAAAKSLRIAFVGGEPHGSLESAVPSRARINYLVGNNLSASRTGVPAFTRLVARQVYEGIDVEYYGTDGLLEYDFRVHPRADPSRIRLHLYGVDDLQVSPDGDLAAADGTILQRRPIAYQTAGAIRCDVPVRYQLDADGTVSFALGEYDRNSPLIIDPVIVYARTIGGSGSERIAEMVEDITGLYAVGHTTSVDFPTTDSFQPRAGGGGTDGLVLKLTPDGSEIEFATYLGGSSWDELHHVAVDAGGNIYVTGPTASTDFPAAPPDACSIRRCAVLAKLSAHADQLHYVHVRPVPRSDSTKLEFSDLAVSADGTAFVIVLNIPNMHYAGVSTLERFDAAGRPTVMSAISFGEHFAGFTAVKVGPAGDVYVEGRSYTVSSSWPYTSTYELFVQRFSPDAVYPGTAPKWTARRSDPWLLTRLLVHPDGSASVAVWASAFHLFTVPAHGGGFGAPVVLSHPSWDSSMRRAWIDVDSAGYIHAVACRDASTPDPENGCAGVLADPAGNIRSTANIPLADVFAAGAGLSFYAGRGGSDVAITKYSWVTVDALSSHAGDRVTAGTPVTWTAGGSPAAGVEYSFYRRHPETGWALVQPYGPSRTYVWTPSRGDVGVHAVQVWARAPGAVEAYESWRGAVVAVDPPPPLGDVRLTTASPLPHAAGHPIAFSASATGGLPPLQYRFVRHDADGWKVVQDYSPRSSYTWTPTPADEGRHSLQVWIREADSTAAYDAWAELDFDIAPAAPVRIVSLTASSLHGAAGVPIVFTANATGGIGPLHYRFVRLDADGWHAAQEYGVGHTYTYTPGTADVGPHAVQVWVRSAGSTASYEAWRGLDFTVGPPVPLTVRLTSDRALPLMAGEPVVWTATAAGGTGPFTYRFVRRDADGWKQVQGYGPSSSYTWTPDAVDLGNHNLQVWVRNAGSSASYDAWGDVAFDVVPPVPARITRFTSSASQVAAGTAVRFSVWATGGMGTRHYKFLRLDADGWHVAQDYGPDSTYVYTPSLEDTGPHTVQVWVRSALSSAAYEDWRGVSFNVGPPEPVKITSFTVSARHVTVGTAVRFDVRATGGIGTLHYKFVRRDADGWHVDQDYGPDPTYVYTPGLEDTGPHTVQVWVRSALSSATYEDWRGDSFTVDPP